MRKVILLAVLLIYSILGEAKIELPPLIADNMVLQQNTKVKLWGQTDTDASISIVTSWNNNKYIATRDGQGEWSVEVETPVAGGPYEISISDGENITLKNILIGEVWFCSGQSNMDMPLQGYLGQPVEEAMETIMLAKESDNIRFFKVQRGYDNQLRQACQGEWVDAITSTLADCSAVAYFYAKSLSQVLDIPVGIITSTWGGSVVEAWMGRDVFENKFPKISLEILNGDIKEIKNPRPHPSLIYNAMVAPVMNYRIKGAIWYQGESNRFDPEMYKKLFPAMVDSWREKWNGKNNFPFYYVQIAPNKYDDPDGLDAAKLRQAQLESLSEIQNSGMIVTADIGNPNVIHPSNKKTVGQRLAMQALEKTYQYKGISSDSPILKSVLVNEGKLILKFDHAERGLHSRDEKITGFEIAAEDKIFYPAKASLSKEGMQVELFCEAVKTPAYIRYCYRNYAPVSLFNNWGLPVSPFFVKISMLK